MPVAGCPARGAAACGYSLAGRGSFLPDYIRTIGIPLFLNRTPFLTVEQLFTEKVRVEFQSRGRYAVQPTEAGADGVVRGEIIGISAAPVGFTDAQLATRYRFTVTVSVKFDDATQKKTLWENPALTFSDEYELSSRISTVPRRRGVSRCRSAPRSIGCPPTSPAQSSPRSSKPFDTRGARHVQSIRPDVR